VLERPMNIVDIRLDRYTEHVLDSGKTMSGQEIQGVHLLQAVNLCLY